MRGIKIKTKANKDDLYYLTKYKNGRDLDTEDKPYTDKLRDVGLINYGLSIRRKIITAKTTCLGLKLLR